MDLTVIIAIFLAVVLVMLLRAIVHIVPQYQRLVVLTFGQFNPASGIAGPGLVLLFPPPVQTSQTVDLREFVVEIPQQTCITKDNAPISIDFITFYQGARLPVISSACRRRASRRAAARAACCLFTRRPALAQKAQVSTVYVSSIQEDVGSISAAAGPDQYRVPRPFLTRNPVCLDLRFPPSASGSCQRSQASVEPPHGQLLQDGPWTSLGQGGLRCMR